MESEQLTWQPQDGWRTDARQRIDAHLVGCTTGGGHPEYPSHEVVRTVLAINREARSMTFARDVPQGPRAQLKSDVCGLHNQTMTVTLICEALS